MSDFLDEKVREIETRLDELRPLFEEYDKLQRALDALKQTSTASAPAAPAATAKPKPKPKPKAARRGGNTARRASSRSDGAAPKRGRKKGSGPRAQQAVELVTERPGITIPELADAMGIKQNYLYRLMPSLAEENRVVKSGRGWHLREQG